MYGKQGCIKILLENGADETIKGACSLLDWVDWVFADCLVKTRTARLHASTPSLSSGTWSHDVHGLEFGCQYFIGLDAWDPIRPILFMLARYPMFYGTRIIGRMFRRGVFYWPQRFGGLVDRLQGRGSERRIRVYVKNVKSTTSASYTAHGHLDGVLDNGLNLSGIPRSMPWPLPLLEGLSHTFPL